MKMLKIIAAIAAFLIFVPFKSANAQVNLNLGNIASSLTGNTGSSAGLALLNLYTQFKADGKLDLSNSNNISNLVTLATNIKGLKGSTSKTDLSSFVNGLISGSKNLVNKGNSTSVLNSLKSISNLDLSSLGNAAVSTATAKAKSNLLGQMAKATKDTADNGDTQKAGSILTDLFKSLK